MHNSIYEVSRSPVPVGQRARAGNMPDWFGAVKSYAQICLQILAE